MSAAETLRYRVEAEEEGLRLDQFLAAHVPGLSRRRARVLLDIGGVFVDKSRVKVASRPMRAGQRVEVVLGGAFDRATKKTGQAARVADAGALPDYRVVFEDDDLLVADKPSGLLTAPTPESDRGNLANLLGRRPGATRVHVVHRIDLETSGLLVFGKSATANRVLSDRFRDHDIEREYWAAVAGTWPAELCSVREPVAGKDAVSHPRLVEVVGNRLSVLAVRLETGRTHQIRVHCAGAGHPVLGDKRYGAATAFDPPRMALHARLLGFAHPVSGEALRFESELPAELATWLEAQR